MQFRGRWLPPPPCTPRTFFAVRRAGAGRLAHPNEGTTAPAYLRARVRALRLAADAVCHEEGHCGGVAVASEEMTSQEDAFVADEGRDGHESARLLSAIGRGTLERRTGDVSGVLDPAVFRRAPIITRHVPMDDERSRRSRRRAVGPRLDLRAAGAAPVGAGAWLSAVGPPRYPSWAAAARAGGAGAVLEAARGRPKR